MIAGNRILILLFVVAVMTAGCGGPATPETAPVSYLDDRVPLDFGPDLAGQSTVDQAWLAFLEGRNDDARRGFGAIGEKEAGPLALFGKAEINLMDGDFSAAAQYHSTLVARFPGHPLARASIERLDRMLLMLTNSRELLAPALEADPSKLALESQLAMARIAAGVAEERAIVAGDKPPVRTRWGTPDSWRWSGPYDSNPLSGFDREYPPEADERLKDSYTLDGRNIETRSLERVGEVIQPPWTSTGVYYLETFVEVPAGDYLVSLRGYSQATVWMDDAQLFTRDVLAEEAPVDLARKVRLEAGRHRILIKYGAGQDEVGMQFFLVPTRDQAPFDIALTEPGAVAGVEPGPMLRLRGGLPDALSEISNDPFKLWLAALFAERSGELSRGRLAVQLATPLASTFTPLLLTDAQLLQSDSGLAPNLRLNEAIEQYQSALEKDPRAGLAHLQLGNLLFQEDQLEDALSHFDAMVSLAPNESRGHWYRFGVLSSLGWTHPAENALETASKLSPSNCNLASELVARRAGRAEYPTPDTLEGESAGCPGVREELVRHYLLPRGELDKAIETYRWLASVEPASAHYQVRLAELLGREGKMEAALERYEEADRTSNLDRPFFLPERVDLLMAAGKQSEARELLRQGLASDPANIELIELARQFGGERVLSDLRRDGLEVVQEYLADPTRDYQQSAFYLLDYAAFRYFEDGSGLSVTHQITRVLNKDAKNRLGEVRVPQGAIVTVLRTIKADGVTTIEPEIIQNKPSISMPNLEVGDFIEFEYITATSPRVQGETSFLAPRWYFQIFEAPLMYSEIIIEVPSSTDPVIDVHGDVPEPTVTERDGFQRYRWLMTEMLDPRPEPNGPSMAEIVPSIQLGYNVDPERFRGAIRDGVLRASRPTGYLRKALELGAAGATEPREVARRLFRFVKTEVADSGEGIFSEPASWVWTRREGSRLALLKALLDMAGIPNEVVLVKAFGNPEEDNPLLPLSNYSDVVLRVDVGEERPLWLEPSQTYARFDYVRPQLQGQPGLSLGRDAATYTVHDYDDAVDRQRMTFELTLDEDGTAVGSAGEVSDGINGTMLRNFISRFEGDPGEVKERLADYIRPYFGDVTVSNYRFEGLESTGEAGVFYDFVANDFARVSEDGLVVQTAIFADELGNSLAQLPSRSQPLILASPIDAEMNVVLHLPEGRSLKTVPQSQTIESPFGRFERKVVQESDGSISLTDTISIPKQRVSPSDYPQFQAFARQIDEAQLISIQAK